MTAPPSVGFRCFPVASVNPYLGTAVRHSRSSSQRSSWRRISTPHQYRDDRCGRAYRWSLDGLLTVLVGCRQRATSVTAGTAVFARCSPAVAIHVLFMLLPPVGGGHSETYKSHSAIHNKDATAVNSTSQRLRQSSSESSAQFKRSPLLVGARIVPVVPNSLTGVETYTSSSASSVARPLRGRRCQRWGTRQRVSVGSEVLSRRPRRNDGSRDSGISVVSLRSLLAFASSVTVRRRRRTRVRLPSRSGRGCPRAVERTVSAVRHARTLR